MKSSRNRKLAALLVFAWVVGHPATRAPLLLAALSLEHAHPGGHSYSLALAEDASHFDLVLSHVGAEDPEHGESPACSGGDHVLHLCGDLALRETARRHDSGDAPALAPSVALPASPVGASTAIGRSAPRGLEPILLRTVVLRC